jgi:tetratricopeptide (TPR) repeat protein
MDKLRREKMKRLKGFVILVCILVGSVQAQDASTPSLDQAKALRDAGKLQESADMLRQLVKQNPQNPEILAWTGFVVGMLAGQSQQDYMAAGRLAMESFGYLDKAVGIDPNQVQARLYRGVMGVNVPPFLNRLDQAIGDLLAVIRIQKAESNKVRPQDHILAWQSLLTGYEKKGEKGKVLAVAEKILTLKPEDEKVKSKVESLRSENPDLKPADLSAEMEIKSLTDAEVTANIGKAKTLIAAKKVDEALSLLKDTAERNSKSTPETYALILKILNALVNKGYDDRIHQDTDFRSKQAFDIMHWSEQSVLAFPEYFHFRLYRDVVSIVMPFFIGKLDQGIEDLKTLTESSASDSIKSQAFYWLGLGYTRKAMEYWNTVVTKYPDALANRQVLDAMRPPIDKVNPEQLPKPAVTIDFISAYQDQIAPQTAVWIEDGKGNYVRTVYVSGFSGYVKEKQVVLPAWANATAFKGVDGVTGASIDLGEHVLIWDLTNLEGKRVPKGAYTIKVEVSHWPSMKYQVAAAEILVGGKSQKATNKEGDFIPYLEVTYLPK